LAGDQPVEPGQGNPGVIQLAPAATVFHDTLERNYPHYPKIEDISLSNAEMVQCIATFFILKNEYVHTVYYIIYTWLQQNMYVSSSSLE
jgi:hypothetical protein